MTLVLCVLVVAMVATAAADTCAPARVDDVVISGRNITIGGMPIFLRGVAWNPYAVGTDPNWGHSPQYMDFVNQDAALMQAAGINAVRTYRPIEDVAVLDALWAHGIFVVMTIFYGA